jgi:urease gamma subunit
VPPFTRFSSLELIKLSKNLRINTNESLVLYCGYLVDQLRARRSIDSIEINAAKILEPDNVMIGVPETLRAISFEVILDNLTIKKISFIEPIPATNYKRAR